MGWIYNLRQTMTQYTELLERERSFVANAAHELRTPLSGLRLQVEVLERKVDEPAARQNTLKKILDGSSCCTRLVYQLLLFSSLESKAVTAQGVRTEIVPWNALLQSAEEDILGAAIVKDISIECNATKEHLGQRFYRPSGQQELEVDLDLPSCVILLSYIIHMKNIEMNGYAEAKIQGIRVSVKFK